MQKNPGVVKKKTKKNRFFWKKKKNNVNDINLVAVHKPISFLMTNMTVHSVEYHELEL